MFIWLYSSHIQVNWPLFERLLFNRLQLLLFLFSDVFWRSLQSMLLICHCGVNTAETEKTWHRNGSPFSSRLWSQAQHQEAYTPAACTMPGLCFDRGMQNYKSLNLHKEWQPFLNSWPLCVGWLSNPSPFLIKVGFISSKSVQINFYSLTFSCVGHFCTWEDWRRYLGNSLLYKGGILYQIPERI